MVKPWNPTQKVTQITAWTDGSGTASGPAGWAFVITEGETELYRESGSVADGTSNIAEMLAAIHALEYCLAEYPDADITLRSDSQYTLRGLAEWMPKWINNGWKNGRGKPVANQEYWRRLQSVVDKLKVTCYHCKGHSGIYYNELCDKLAGEARKERCHVAV